MLTSLMTVNFEAWTKRRRYFFEEHKVDLWGLEILLTSEKKCRNSEMLNTNESQNDYFMYLK